MTPTIVSRSSGLTARFAAVVQQAGAPEQVIPWKDPARDPKFQRAVRENRVMTVTLPTVGTKKDFGVVGFEREKNAAFLIFPKSLKKFEDKKIVGIKYDLLASPKAEGKPVKSVPSKTGVRRALKAIS